jgi:TusA-related sulfurtransferase
MEFRKINKSVDVSGAYSPYPEIRVRDTLKEMKGNQVLKVLSTDKVASEITIPRYCEHRGYPCKVEQLADSQFEVFIQKVDLEAKAGDMIIDVRGQFSPLPEIRTRDEYGVAAKKTIPHFCEKEGYEYQTILGKGLWLLLIKR